MNAPRNRSRRARRKIRVESLEDRRLLSTLQGEKWVDTDGNSQRDPGEPPLAGVIVYLDANDDQQLDRATETFTTTDADGRYSFEVEAGDYIVREVQPEGFRQTFPLPTPARLFAHDRSVPAQSPTNPDRIVEFEPLNGMRLDSFLTDVNVGARGNGLAYDPDRNVIFHIDNRQRILRTYDADTGALLKDRPRPSGLGSPDGLAFLDGKLYLQDSNTNRILRLDPLTYGVEQTIDIVAANPGRVIDLNGGLGELSTPLRALIALTGSAGGDAPGDEILLLDPDTGEVISSFQHARVDNDVFDLGVTAIRSQIYVGFSVPASFSGGEPTGEVHVYRVDGTLVQRYTEPFAINSLAASDPGKDDAHRVTVGDQDELLDLHFGNQPIPRVTFETSASMVEEGEGTDAHEVTLVLQVPGGVTLHDELSVDVFDLENGSASTPDDYEFTTTTVTFAAGAADGSTQSVAVDIQNDEFLEIDETLNLRLTNLVTSFGIIGIPDEHEVTIVDDDEAVLTIGDVTMEEGDSGQTQFTFAVTLDKQLQERFSVDFATVDDTATAGSDYQAASGTLSFAGDANETQTVTVTVNGDQTVEQDEVFLLVLSSLQAGGRNIVVPDPAEGTILNDDMAEVAIGNVRLNEGLQGPTMFEFPVTLSSALEVDLSVDFATGDGSAQSGDGDYAEASGTLTIPAGETMGAITVEVQGDAKVEADEDFFVVLSNLQPEGAGAILVDERGDGVILNDDAAVFTVHSTSGNEDDGPLAFTIELSNPAAADTSLQVTTADGSATVGDDDYTPLNGRTVDFPAGSTSQTFTVPLTADAKVEADESFSVRLGNVNSGGLNVSASDDPAEGKILNDDQATFSIEGASGHEDDGPLSFTINLSSPVAVATSVQVSTEDGSATVADGDYTPLNGRTVDFPAGSDSQTISVALTADNMVEADESFLVRLSNANGGGLAVSASDDPAEGKILNDDQAGFSVGDAGGNEDDGPLTFIITLSNPVDVDTRVQVDTADGSATTADDDYTPRNGLSVEFPAGSTSQTFTVDITADNKAEADESFTVELGAIDDGGRPLSVDNAQGNGQILNDDLVRLSIENASLAEGDSGSTLIEFPVSLSAALDVPLTVAYSTADGDATTSDNDYVEASGTLTFDAGSVSETISVEILGDTVVELDEAFFVMLSNLTATGRSVEFEIDQAEGTIINDDFDIGDNHPPMIISINNSSPGCGELGQGDHRGHDDDDKDDDDHHGEDEGQRKGGHGDHNEDDSASPRTVSIVASFIDPDVGDTHSAEIFWGDGLVSAGELQEPAGDEPGVITGVHEYDEGGIYTITVVVTDAAGASDSATTITFVTGVGLHDGVLQIIGTDDRDRVSLNLVNGHQQRRFRIHTDFADRWTDVPASEVERILIVLCDDHDSAHLAGNIYTPAILDGGEGNDFLKGGRGADILLGGTGRDSLNGHKGRDLLVGGLDGDRLVGGPQDDILIGGTTAYDSHYEALQSILREWNSMRSFDDRVENIQTASGPILEPLGVYLNDGNSDPPADEPTVFDDGAYDRLSGSSGQDWFFWESSRWYSKMHRYSRYSTRRF